MKKKLSKLTLTVESLRVLDTQGLAGAANTQQTSCQPTCGIIPASVDPCAVAVRAVNPGASRPCCV